MRVARIVKMDTRGEGEYLKMRKYEERRWEGRRRRRRNEQRPEISASIITGEACLH